MGMQSAAPNSDARSLQFYTLPREILKQNQPVTEAMWTAVGDRTDTRTGQPVGMFDANVHGKPAGDTTVGQTVIDVFFPSNKETPPLYAQRSPVQPPPKGVVK